MNFFEILGTAFGGGTWLYYCHHQVRLLASQDPWGRGEGQGEVICSRGLMFSLVRETWPCLTAGKAKIGICSRGLAFSLVRDNVAMLNSRKPFFPSAVQKVI